MTDKELNNITNFILIWAFVGIVIYFIALYPIFAKNGILNFVQEPWEKEVLFWGFGAWFIYLILGVRYSYKIIKFINKIKNNKNV
jgi:hypothetical protein